MRQMGIWAVVERGVHIKQKTVKHSPLEKLLDAFINILAGGQGLCEVNTRVRPDRALQRAFGRARCADQSQVSQTLNCCVEGYGRATRQLAVRRKDKNGAWKVRVLVTTLDDAALFWLAQQPFRKEPQPVDIMRALAYAYDLRDGAVETSIKDSKQGLGLTKRNKRSFAAQEMLVLLAQLAINVISDTQ
jgi:hypothetical protein